ncbi:MAG TPA: hypothetical protein VFZ32_02055 [Micromonosporaceae bacterium]
MGAKSLLSGVVVVTLVLGGGYLLVQYLEDHPVYPLTSECEASSDDTTVRLDAEQMAHASTIAAVGLRRDLPRQAVTVALATALQESKLRNLGHGDRDSLGLFQQRPSQGWGEPDQLNDPRYAAGAFYDRLVRVPDWQRMRVTEAAQAVQRSAHPEAYQKWAGEAAVLAKALSGESPASLACTLRGQATVRTGGARTVGNALELDWGEVTVREPRRGDRLRLAVRTERAGWRLAHWLVSHAAKHGIERVSYAGHEWTAQRGQWRSAEAGTATVTAALHQSRQRD